MSENATRAGIAAAGLIGGALLGYAVGSRAADDDRPPIIVKGGSLIFQSGDPNSSEQEEKQGKPWKQVGNDWQPDHDDGKKTTWFSVAISGGSGSCPTLSMTREVRFVYADAQGNETTFALRTKPRGPNKPNAPAIEGSGLTTGGTSANPQLIYGTAGQGTFKRVSFSAQGSGSVLCNEPSSVKVWQF